MNNNIEKNIEPQLEEELVIPVGQSTVFMPDLYSVDHSGKITLFTPDIVLQKTNDFLATLNAVGARVVDHFDVEVSLGFERTSNKDRSFREIKMTRRLLLIERNA